MDLLRKYRQDSGVVRADSGPPSGTEVPSMVGSAARGHGGEGGGRNPSVEIDNLDPLNHSDLFCTAKRHPIEYR